MTESTSHWPCQTFPASQPAGTGHTRATIRASLACLPCRSKHIKCDGSKPSCTRCILDEKACLYTKSRRGVRNCNRRNVTNDALIDHILPPPLAGLDFHVKNNGPFLGGWMASSEPRPTQFLEYLFNLYYTNFHDTHPWLPPRQIMDCLVQSHPNELNLAIMMVLYIGLVYTSKVDTAPLRERVYALASGPLKRTVWDVQALLSLSVAACGENYTGVCGEFFEKALQIALELGLQNKSFADAEPDPILAESYRRTYWAIYLSRVITNSARASRPFFALYYKYHYGPPLRGVGVSNRSRFTFDVAAFVLLLTLNQKIPTPVSLEEYYDRSVPRDYSSWAYLIGLIQIRGEYVVPLLNVGVAANQNTIDRADNRIVSWLLQLPQWKKDLVDPDGAVDMVLYTALGIAYGLRIRIHLHLHGAGVRFAITDLVSQGPIFQDASLLPPSLASKSHPWLYGSIALQVSLCLVGLFKSRIPPEKSSPSCTLGIERAVMPLLNAYIFGRRRLPVLKEIIMLLANVLKRVGDFWPIARNVSGDIVQALEVADNLSNMQVAGECQGSKLAIDQLISSYLREDGGEGEVDSIAGDMALGVQVDVFEGHKRIGFKNEKHDIDK